MTVLAPPDVQRLSPEDRFMDVSGKVSNVLAKRGIDLNKDTPEKGLKDELEGNSGTKYTVSVGVENGNMRQVVFSSAEDTWIWNENDKYPAFNYLQYQKAANGEIKEFGGYNTGEVERGIKKSSDYARVSVFDKFDGLVKDLSPK